MGRIGRGGKEGKGGRKKRGREGPAKDFAQGPATPKAGPECHEDSSPILATRIL
jgi:hypothetical protein